MKKVYRAVRRIGIYLCLFLLALCLVGARFSILANAQEEEPKSVVEFTSYTSVLDIGEVYEFAAQVTSPTGVVTNAVTWSSSNEDVILMDDNLATALDEGTATITATAADGGYATIDVLVSKDETIRVRSIEVYPAVLELGVGWKTRVGYTILPQDAYEQRVTWASSDPSVITVDENGNVEAIAKGTATITVTPRDTLNGVSAVCPVQVYDDLEQATLTSDTLVTTIGQRTDNTMNLVLPDGVTGSSYRWYSMDDTIASFGCCPPGCHCGYCYGYSSPVASISSWNFGTTTVYAVAHGSDGKVYAAMGTVHVTEEYFYIGGLESVNATNPWITYSTKDAAEAAGVLLVPSEDDPYVYSITRSFWALDDFQILNNTLKTGEDWPTRITSTSFVEEGSTMPYIANTVDMFRVNALGTYTVTLDLSDGRAKVTIEMVTLEVTSFDLSVDAESKPYLQGEDDTMTLDVYTIPENATIDLENVEVTLDLPEASDAAVTATPRLQSGKLYIDLTLNTAPASNTTFDLDLRIKNAIDYATDSIKITILADGETYVPVSDISFNDETYLVNVNNGANPWISSTPLNATVNADASVQDIVYTEDSEDIYIEYIGEQAYVHAAALGTYTIYATSLGTNAEGDTITTETTVLVTSLIENKNEAGEVESYASGFYLIGILDGVEVANWTSIKPEETEFGNSPFAAWQLPLDPASKAMNIYTGSFHFTVDDRFSIAFLGMAGNWNGIVNERYFDWASSYGKFYESNGNVQITVSGTYNIALSLAGDTTTWTLNLITPDDTNLEYRLYYYLVRACCSWDPLLSEEGNTLAQIGYIDMLDGVAQGSFVYTMEGNIDFYAFYETTGAWPTVQIVSAIARNYKVNDTEGIVGGYFQEATWYGCLYDGSITFGGTAYTATGEENHFRNNGAELTWIGEGEYYDQIPADMEGKMTVSFSITVDSRSGVLTGVTLNFVTASMTDQAE